MYGKYDYVSTLFQCLGDLDSNGKIVFILGNPLNLHCAVLNWVSTKFYKMLLIGFLDIFQYMEKTIFKRLVLNWCICHGNCFD